MLTKSYLNADLELGTMLLWRADLCAIRSRLAVCCVSMLCAFRRGSPAKSKKRSTTISEVNKYRGV